MIVARRSMKKSTIEKNLRKLIAGMSNNYDLECLKSIIDEQIYLHRDDPTNFMFHTTMDNYFYYVVYRDGTQHMGCIGQREFERFQDSEDAVSIWRRDKDFLWHKEKNYPMELLMQKA